MIGRRARVAACLIASAWLAATPAARADDVSACVDAATEGQTVRDRGELVAAQRAFVTCAQRQCPADVSAACTRWLADVSRRLPSVVFRVQDAAGVDLTDVAVRADGALVLDRLTGRSVELNPGVHKLRFERAGGRTVEREVMLAEGEKDRLLVITWPAEPRPEPAAPVAAPRRSVMPAAVWAFGGAGLVALGVSAVLGLRGISRADELRTSCGPRCPESERDDIVRTLVVADVALAVGLVALGVAGYFALTAGAQRPTTTSSTTMSIP